MTIPALIDKQDNFEIVRDQIAFILATEVASQMALATLAAKDPDDWKLRTFLERSNPWEQFQNPSEAGFDSSPIVNIWYDSSNFDQTGSNISERQKSEAVYNIDCYGFAISEDDGAGHKPGDREAALEVQRAVRLVRNILMASEYTYLGLPRGTVWRRWPGSITSFQPQIDGRTVQGIVGARLVLRVEFSEFAPQGDESNLLELVHVDITRASDGLVLLEAEYPSTP